MEHRVAAWESMPWEAGGRGGCRAWRKDGRHEGYATSLQVPLRFHLFSLEVPLRNRQSGFPPFRRISHRYRSLAPIPTPGSPLE